MRAFALLVLLVLSGCGQPKAQEKPKLSDAQYEELRKGVPGMSEACLNVARFHGIEALPQAVDKCFEMTPRRRWRGMWARDFELSRFCPAAASDCTYESPGDNIWLSFAEGVSSGTSSEASGLYAIEFEGRRTAKKRSFGHLSEFDHEMVVDRVISLKKIERTPKR